MNCLHCGTANPTTARFCHACGRPILAVLGTLPKGAILQGRYRIERLLGQGGMGAVYLAEHLALGDWLAIKEMREDLLAPGERAAAVARFQAEARTLARLRHPNLPRVLDHFAENKRWYLVMDYVEGQTLEQVQAAAGGGPLPPDQVLGWAGQLGDVLGYLHGQNPPLVFRDLKPANIMLDNQGQIQLIDFGIARFFHPAKSTDTLKMGTVGYAPPEQYAGRGQTTPRSDLYALGATLHQLLTGADPSATPFALPPPRDLNPRLSPQVSDAVGKALSLDPADRFASAAEMNQALLGDAPQPAAAWTAWQRAALLLLATAVVAMIAILGLIVAGELLGDGATPTATVVAAVPTVTASATTAPTVTPFPATATPLAPSATAILTPSSWLTPTLISPDTPQPPTSTAIVPTTMTPRPPRPSVTPKPNPQSPPAPALRQPDPGATLNGKPRFEWQWNHPALAEGQAFDLLIWAEKEKDLDRSRWRGAITPWRETWAEVELGDLATVWEHGEGTYYWTVIVVQKEPYKRIGRWGEFRSFLYRAAATPPTNTPKPPPTDTRSPSPTKPPMATDTPAPPTATPIDPIPRETPSPTP